MSKSAVRRVVTTDELRELVAAGKKVTLRRIVRPDEAVLRQFPDDDVDRLYVPAEDNPVVSVEYVRDEPVQCISVDHPDHLYITDNMIPTHNTSNIVFLKSTDDSMLDTLQKMSGTRHVSYIDSKTVTRDQQNIIKATNVEGKVSYTMSTKEEPVISYNDMAFISERQSIVFRAGDAPVWNRNETILPMSWRLFMRTIEHPGHVYSLQTIPTLSSALDFDVRMNQPDFHKMLAKRMEQAILAGECADKYRKAYDYSELDVTRLDPDVYSEQVMELVDAQMREEFAITHGQEDPDYIDPDELEGMMMLVGDATEDAEMRLEMQRQAAQQVEYTRKRYAGGTISREMLVHRDNSARHTLDGEMVEAYKSVRSYLESDTENFSVNGSGSLCSADGRVVYISKPDQDDVIAHLKVAAADDESRVFAEDAEQIEELGTHKVHDEFYRFLAEQGSWIELGRGEFDRRMATLMRENV